MRTHWYPRPMWADDLTRLAWFLTFLELGPSAVFGALTAAAHPVLYDAGLDVVPRHLLHQTMVDLGQVDEFQAYDLDVLVGKARERLRGLQRPARITFDRIVIRDESVCLEGDMNDGVYDLVARVLGEPRELWLHVALAYAHDDAVDEDALREQLAIPRHTLPVYGIPSVDLVTYRQDRTARTYFWEPLWCWPTRLPPPVQGEACCGGWKDVNQWSGR